MRSFDSLSERDILAALAISLEDELQVGLGGALVFVTGLLIGSS